MKLERRYGVISLLVRLSMIAIGLTLPAWLYLSELRPRWLIHEMDSDFRALAIACDQAVRSIVMVSDVKDRIDESQAFRLERTFEIGRIPCRDFAELREYLLSQLVSQNALTSIQLAATSDPFNPKTAYARLDPDSLDSQLRIITRSFGLAPLTLKPYVRDAKFLLGEKLFYDNDLSGFRNRSCATCHQQKFAMADVAEVEPRMSVPENQVPEIPARNVPDLWNRDHNNVSSLLWDGRIEATLSGVNRIKLPEDLATTDFENMMAIQSVRPIFTPVEMLGQRGSANELAPDLDGFVDPATIMNKLSRRLLGKREDNLANWHVYRSLFENSYGVTEPDQIKPAHIGNALAHYIEIEFQSRETPWDRYLAGDMTALTNEAKLGALLFYGIGRCSICHSGDVFSDFKFHSIGAPDANPNKDLGRYYATRNPEDQYLFRTPPLRNVTLTAPYFHNGRAGDLREALEQHIFPYRYTRNYTATGEHLMSREEVEAISPLIAAPNFITPTQIELLIAYLKALEDKKAGVLR